MWLFCHYQQIPVQQTYLSPVQAPVQRVQRVNKQKLKKILSAFRQSYEMSYSYVLRYLMSGHAWKKILKKKREKKREEILSSYYLCLLQLFRLHFHLSIFPIYANFETREIPFGFMWSLEFTQLLLGGSRVHPEQVIIPLTSTLRDNLEIINLRTMIFGCGRNLGFLEKIHQHTRRSCKLHTAGI